MSDDKEDKPRKVRLADLVSGKVKIVVDGEETSAGTQQGMTLAELMKGKTSSSSVGGLLIPATALTPPAGTPFYIAESKREELALAERKRRSAMRFILGLQRAPDGYASFSFTDIETGDWVESHSVQVSHLQPLFPEFLDDLLTKPDARVSVHSMLCPGPLPSKIKLSEKALKALPTWYAEKYKGFIAGALRKKKYVKYLNACFADLDIYRKNISPAIALGAIKHLQDTGQIPKASMVIFSGHGAWVFWLLVDSKNPYSPPRLGPGTWERGMVYRQVQREIAKGLEVLGADTMASTNLTVMTRFPGSKHGGTGQETEFWIPLTEGRGHVYTLEEMQNFFGVTLRELAPVERRAIDGIIKDRKDWGGFKRVFASHLRQFHALWDLRGKFQEHTRNRAALLYAHLLNRNGLRREEVRRRVVKFAEEGCEPQLKAREAVWAVREALKIRFDRDKLGSGGFSNATIAKMLLITQEEATQLETWPAQAAPPPAPKTHPDAIQAELLRAEIAKIVQEGKQAGRRLTCREVAVILRERGIAEIHFATVNRHMSRVRHGTKSTRAYRKKRQGRLSYSAATARK